MLDYNLYPWQVFRAVARLGSVTRAAAELAISQPAVSAHLKTLEQAIGEALFERAPRRMMLTAAGEAAREQVDRLFAFYEEIPQAIAGANGRFRGEVTVAASSTPGAYLLPKLLRVFERRYPEVRTVLRIGDSAQVVEWVLGYHAPLGIVGEIRLPDEIEKQEIDSDQLRLVAAAGDPLCRLTRIQPPHLRGRTLFLREPGSSTRAETEAMFGESLKLFDRVVEIPSTEAIKQMVVAKLGVAVLSSWAIRIERKAGILEPTRDRRWQHTRRFYLVKRRDRQLGGNALALWGNLVKSPGNAK